MPTDRFEWTETGEVQYFDGLPRGLKAVRATYSSGWTAGTLPKDLRDALIDMVTLIIQAIANFSSVAGGEEAECEEGGSSGTASGQLKKFSAGSYSEEYPTAESDAF